MSTRGWRLTVTQEQRSSFTVANTKFIVTTSRWPNSVSAEAVGQHLAHSLNALHVRRPETFDIELGLFLEGQEGAFRAILFEAYEVVHILHPEVEGYANDLTLSVSKRP